MAAKLAVRGPWANAEAARQDAHELGRQFTTGCIDETSWALEMQRHIENAYTVDEILAIHDAILIGEYDGVCDLIDRIHRAGLATASLSNTNARHWQTLQTYPAVRKLQHPHASHMLGFQKPDPAIYQEFQRRINRQPHEILFFDDLPENIQAAEQCGWNVELIDPHAATHLQIESALVRRGLV